MKDIILEIKDQVNCRLIGLDPATRRKVRNNNRYFQQYARHTAQFKAGYWDGYEYMIDMGGRTYLSQLETILPDVVAAGYNIEIDDKRESKTFTFPEITDDIFSDTLWPANHKFEGEPIILMDHQVEALNTYMKNPHGIQVLPTSAGKTIITAAMAKLCEPYGRTIIIVPNKSLVTQTEEDFVNLDLDVGVYYGDRKDLDKTHTICTWQSLSILDKKAKKDIDAKARLLELLELVDTVIVDEVHQASAKELKNILSGPLSHCPIRWGLTGTMPKDEFAMRIIKNVIGEVVAEVTPKALQDIGHLAQCDIEVLQLKDPFEFPDYHAEAKYLLSDEKRLRWIAKKVTEVSSEGNTLILVGKIETGKLLTQYTEELGFEAVFISGGTKAKDRAEEYASVHEAEGKIMYATYGVAAVGINIPRIFNLFLIEPGRSFVRVIQSIGRGLRTAKDKDEVKIYDITSSCKFSKRHLTDRKKFYAEKQYPYKIKKIDWL